MRFSIDSSTTKRQKSLGRIFKTAASEYIVGCMQNGQKLGGNQKSKRHLNDIFSQKSIIAKMGN